MNPVEQLSGLLRQRLEELGPLPEAQWELVRPLLGHRVVPNGGFLLRAGEIGSTIGYVCSGLLRYFYTGADGREFTRYFCTAGNFVSPPTGSEGASYSVVAAGQTELLTIDVERWQRLVTDSLYWAQVALSLQQHALLLAERRERSLILKSATERYLDLLAEFPGLEQSVRQYDIASYLGITPVALSRLRGRKDTRS